LARKFRKAGLACEVLLEESGDKLTKQFMLAEKKGVPFLVIPGENALSDTLTIRDIAKRENHEGLSFEQALGIIQ